MFHAPSDNDNKAKLSTNMNKCSMNVVGIDIFEMYSPLFNYIRKVIFSIIINDPTSPQYTYMANTLYFDSCLGISQHIALKRDHVVV